MENKLSEILHFSKSSTSQPISCDKKVHCTKYPRTITIKSALRIHAARPRHTIYDFRKPHQRYLLYSSKSKALSKTNPIHCQWILVGKHCKGIVIHTSLGVKVNMRTSIDKSRAHNQRRTSPLRPNYQSLRSSEKETSHHPARQGVIRSRRNAVSMAKPQLGAINRRTIIEHTSRLLQGIGGIEKGVCSLESAANPTSRQVAPHQEFSDQELSEAGFNHHIPADLCLDNSFAPSMSLYDQQQRQPKCLLKRNNAGQDDVQAHTASANRDLAKETGDFRTWPAASSVLCNIVPKSPGADTPQIITVDLGSPNNLPQPAEIITRELSNLRINHDLGSSTEAHQHQANERVDDSFKTNYPSSEDIALDWSTQELHLRGGYANVDQAPKESVRGRRQTRCQDHKRTPRRSCRKDPPRPVLREKNGLKTGLKIRLNDFRLSQARPLEFFDCGYGREPSTKKSIAESKGSNFPALSTVLSSHGTIAQAMETNSHGSGSLRPPIPTSDTEKITPDITCSVNSLSDSAIGKEQDISFSIQHLPNIMCLRGGKYKVKDNRASARMNKAYRQVRPEKLTKYFQHKTVKKEVTAPGNGRPMATNRGQTLNVASSEVSQWHFDKTCSQPQINKIPEPQPRDTNYMPRSTMKKQAISAAANCSNEDCLHKLIVDFVQMETARLRSNYLGTCDLNEKENILKELRKLGEFSTISPGVKCHACQEQDLEGGKDRAQVGQNSEPCSTASSASSFIDSVFSTDMQCSSYTSVETGPANPTTDSHKFASDRIDFHVGQALNQDDHVTGQSKVVHQLHESANHRDAKSCVESIPAVHLAQTHGASTDEGLMKSLCPADPDAELSKPQSNISRHSPWQLPGILKPYDASGHTYVWGGMTCDESPLISYTPFHMEPSSCRAGSKRRDQACVSSRSSNTAMRLYSNDSVEHTYGDLSRLANDSITHLPFAFETGWKAESLERPPNISLQGQGDEADIHPLVSDLSTRPRRARRRWIVAGQNLLARVVSSFRRLGSTTTKE